MVVTVSADSLRINGILDKSTFILNGEGNGRYCWPKFSLNSTNPNPKVPSLKLKMYAGTINDRVIKPLFYLIVILILLKQPNWYLLIFNLQPNLIFYFVTLLTCCVSFQRNKKIKFYYTLELCICTPLWGWLIHALELVAPCLFCSYPTEFNGRIAISVIF